MTSENTKWNELKKRGSGRARLNLYKERVCPLSADCVQFMMSDWTRLETQSRILLNLPAENQHLFRISFVFLRLIIFS